MRGAAVGSIIISSECELVMKTGSVVHLRNGALGELSRVIEQSAARRILFVIDEAAYAACGAEPIVEPVLKACDVARFTGFEPNPKIHDIERGIAQFRECPPDLVLALGGGTAIDLGKLIGSLAAQPDPPREIITGRACISRVGPPLIAVPTTSGTGSEATHFAVAYIGDDKYSVAHPTLRPACALIDPRLTYSLPASITAATGLDAFCQAIESLWAVGATEESIEFAVEAAALALRHLVPATREPTPEDRLGMCRASHLAGRAIDISKTTAPHALSYAMTSRHGIAHGSAVALTLSRMLAYNAAVTDADCVDPRGTEHVRGRIATILALLEATSVEAACERIDSVIAAVGSPVSLREAGVVQPEQVQQIIDSVNDERMSNNPRRATREALWKLLVEHPSERHG
jgi:alcohol dehydrogenase